jgi:hypothetical protein
VRTDERAIVQISFPALFAAAEKVSANSQRTFLTARGAEFALLVASAGFGEIPRKSISDAGPWIAIVAFALALVIRLSGVGDQAEKRWYDARAAAESIKSSAWQFAVGSSAFPLAEPQAAEAHGGSPGGISRRAYSGPAGLVLK